MKIILKIIFNTQYAPDEVFGLRDELSITFADTTIRHVVGTDGSDGARDTTIPVIYNIVLIAESIPPVMLFGFIAFK